jgi:hypothetical protein
MIIPISVVLNGGSEFASVFVFPEFVHVLRSIFRICYVPWNFHEDIFLLLGS